jgi:hypothetical protein
VAATGFRRPVLIVQIRCSTPKDLERDPSAQENVVLIAKKGRSLPLVMRR